MNEVEDPASRPAEHGTGLSGEPQTLTPGNRWRQVFPGEERQIGLVRRWLESLLPECPARDDVVVVASEMSSNAVHHTASGRGGSFAVVVIWRGPVVHVAVADGGGPGEPRVIVDPEGEHGRGLRLVAGLSLRTAACGDHNGRVVWADVAWDERVPVPVRDQRAAGTGDGVAAFSHRFAGVPAWFGRSTLQWWALAGDELLAASSAEELANLVSRVLDRPGSRTRSSGDFGHGSWRNGTSGRTD